MNDQKATNTARTVHSELRTPNSALPTLRDRGFTYLALLAAIVIIGITLGSATKYWSHITLREKEKELIFRGNQYKDAIGRYYNARPGVKMYPQSIDNLLNDSRSINSGRHLRRKYKDPITGEDFIVIKGQQVNGKKVIGISGVKSKSDDEPLKKANFSEENKEFEGKSKYSEWVFKYTPQTTQPPPPPLPVRP
ncbi:MAG TPA: type II secretion system pseudopilin PulG [Nitrospiraceae bacterium]|nr:type II secretion system pseudopilin PulG [Nitrospiraceae bacterium]